MYWSRCYHLLVLLVVGIIISGSDCGGSSSRQSREIDLASYEKDIKDGLTSFAVDFFKTLLQNPEPTKSSETKKNILFSPLNLYTAFALVHLGAGGNTRDELASLLGLSKETSSVHPTHKALSHVLQNLKNSSDVTLEIGNGLFVQEKFPISSSYVNATNNLYDSKIQNVNFVTDGENTMKLINDWISQKTHEKIPKLFQEPLSPDTVIVLISTLYFKGNWLYKFKQSATKKEQFTTINSNPTQQQIEVDMMSHEAYVPYSNNSQLQYEAISLPYEDSEFSMLIVLPYTTNTIDNLLQSLDTPSLKRLIVETTTISTTSGSEMPTYVHYKIPKFKFSLKYSAVEDILKSLGVRDVFGQNANLLNMMNATNVYVSKITHASQVEVHESGTVASAVTAIEMVARSGARVPKHKVVEFFANRPFLFYIYHRNQNLILFTGVVYQPVNES